MTVLPDFLPSTHGLHFHNSWPKGTPDLVVHVPPPVGDVSIGDASNGLCGGMAFTVADLYLAGLPPPPDTAAPAGQSPLFRYLFDRLLTSFHIPDGVMTYYRWACTADGDTRFWRWRRQGLAALTIAQLPRITAAIDANRPAPLGLVTVRSFNPGDLKKCHQVLAYGYAYRGSRVTLRVYDPNQPDGDDVTVSLDTANPTRATAIDSSVHCEPIRGFFLTDYEAKDPSSVAGTP
jgi:hypothetical protein